MKNIIIKLFLILIATIFFVSCSDDRDYTHHITFDDVAGYTSSPSLVKNQAKSGNTSIMVSPEQEYGLTYRTKFDMLTSVAVKKIHVSVWVKTETDLSSAKLVCAVDDTSKTVVWNSLETKTFAPQSGQWTEMEGDFDLGNNGIPNNTLVIYPWNSGKGKVWFDDLDFSLTN